LPKPFAWQDSPFAQTGARRHAAAQLAQWGIPQANGKNQMTASLLPIQAFVCMSGGQQEPRFAQAVRLARFPIRSDRCSPPCGCATRSVGNTASERQKSNDRSLLPIQAFVCMSGGQQEQSLPKPFAWQDSPFAYALAAGSAAFCAAVLLTGVSSGLSSSAGFSI
jgi:hypothetical protein